jgi:hypothetical protein
MKTLATIALTLAMLTAAIACTADDRSLLTISPDWPRDGSMMICSVIRCWTMPQPTLTNQK